MNNTIEKGYTVIYNTSDGKIAIIGIDDHSGGYPFFSSWVESKNVFKEIGKAFALLRSAKNMTTYYGKEKVHFGTMRVVKMQQVFTEIKEEEEDIFLKQTLDKLNEDELAVLQRHGIVGGAK